jgi:HEXXH motif-containing protein
MQHNPHRLPEAVFSALAQGGGGATAVRHLRAAERSRHLLLILGVVDAAREAGHQHADAVDEAYERLSMLERRAPAAVDRLIRHPAVGAWAKHTVAALLGQGPFGHDPTGGVGDGLAGPGWHDPAGLGSVAAAAALVAGVPYEGEVPVAGGYVMLPSLGALRVPAADGLVRLRTDRYGQVRIADRQVSVGEGMESDDWRGLHRLTAEAGGYRVSVLLDDLDPYRWPAATVAPGRTRAAERRALAGHLRDAWRILVDGHRTIAAETADIVTVLTPILGPEQGQNSASSSDLFGTVALSQPPDGLWLASTFAHEVQHAKLSALLSVVQLVLPDDGQRYYAPWRDDPRPVGGLLQGAYAYLGVTGFWRRQRALLPPGDDQFRAEVEFARWREAAYQATGTLLASGRLTEAGHRFVELMRGTLEGWLAEPAPEEAGAAARQAATLHVERWMAAYGWAAVG